MASTDSSPRPIRPSAAAPVRLESRRLTLSDGCCRPRLDGDADRAGKSPTDDLADLDRLLVEAGKLRCALECKLLVGDLVAVDVVRASWVAESIPRKVLQLLHCANVSHAHVETVKILASNATGYDR